MSDRIRKLIAEHDGAYKAWKALPEYAPAGVRGELSDKEAIARARAANAVGVDEDEFMRGREVGVWRHGPKGNSVVPNSQLIPARKLPLRPLGGGSLPRRGGDNST